LWLSVSYVELRNKFDFLVKSATHELGLIWLSSSLICGHVLALISFLSRLKYCECITQCAVNVDYDDV
jgi:hypothetical protein